MATPARRPLSAASLALVAGVVVLGLGACAQEPPVGSTQFADSTELAAAMTRAGVECKDPRQVAKTADMSMSTCTNPDFNSLNIVVFENQEAFARLLRESKARDGKQVSATTAIYGQNWATLGAAKDAQTVTAAAQKLQAQLATLD